jgi:hypothetical protein
MVLQIKNSLNQFDRIRNKFQEDRLGKESNKSITRISVKGLFFGIFEKQVHFI